MIDNTKLRSPLLPVRHQPDFFVCDVFDAALKGDSASREHPIFSLSKKPDMKTRRYGGSAMINLPHGARIWLACGVTDLRRGFDGLAALVQSQLAADPYGGHLFVFRGRRGNRLKILWWSGDGLNLFAKRLDGGRFVWPQTATGTVAMTGAELSMLLEGIDWRRTRRTTMSPNDPDRVTPTLVPLRE